MNSYRRHALTLNREARDIVAAEKKARDDAFRAKLAAHRIHDTDADAIPRLQAGITEWERELVDLGPVLRREDRVSLRRQIRAANRRIERLQENTP